MGRTTKYLVDVTEKPCTSCNIVKHIEDFPLRNNRISGRQSSCKKCYQKYHSKMNYEKSKANPDYTRGRNLWKNYKMTLDEYDNMLISQDGVCKVCGGQSLGKGRYHVDHDHKTGKIRGLLCHKCNVALGMVQDDISHLKALIKYLKEIV